MASPASAPHADVLGERGKALARSLQAVLAALDDYAAKNPEGAAALRASLVSHLRSSDAQAFLALPAVEIPIVTSPVIGPAPQSEIERELNDGRGYKMNVRTADGVTCAVFTLADDSDATVVGFTPEQWEQLEKDAGAVKAAMRGAGR